MTEHPNPIRLDDLISYVAAQHPDADPLQHLSDAVTTSSTVGAIADHLVGHYVDQARASGASWAEIGECLGVTRQAVQKRFVPREDSGEDPDFPTGGRLSRFTARARNGVHYARELARERGDSQVSTEHLLLGLLSEPEGLAVRAMIAAGASPDQIREATLGVMQPGRDRLRSRERGHTPRFGRGAKKTVELSLREALRMGHNYIGTEHILLAILRHGAEPASIVLSASGVTHERAETWLVAEIEAIRQAKARSAG
jgi:hypothetical protein